MQVKMLTMLYTMLEAAAAALSVLPTGDRFIQNLKDYGPGLTHASDPRIMQVPATMCPGAIIPLSPLCIVPCL